jgi:SAM-dependent methyltransferase
MPPGDASTHRLFQHDRVAAGYASARPYLHPRVFAQVREMIVAEARLGRALDVGCGTGLSSFALLDVAEGVVGIDASLDMLRHAIHADAVSSWPPTPRRRPSARARSTSSSPAARWTGSIACVSSRGRRRWS